MKRIFTVLMLLPLTSFAMEKPGPIPFPALIVLAHNGQKQERNIEIFLNKEAIVTFDSFKSPDPNTYTYTVKLLALKHSKIALFDKKKETVNIKIEVERNEQHGTSDGGNISRDQKRVRIDQRKDIDLWIIGERNSKAILGLIVGRQAVPKAKL